MIEFTHDVYDGIIDHAEEGVPDEVCGVLGGEYGEGTTRVGTARRATNAADTPRYEYYIDPEEQFELMEAIEAEGGEVAGFYHSHPAGPTTPSPTDAARATWPGLSYVIVVLAGEQPFVGSWRWNDDAETFDQEIVAIRDGA